MLECRDRGGGHQTVQGKASENDPEDPDMWEKDISRIRAEGAFVFSNSSLLEGGNVGGGAFIMNKAAGTGVYLWSEHGSHSVGR